LAFSAYRAALDREERAAHVYAGLLTGVATALPTIDLNPTSTPPFPAGATRGGPARRRCFVRLANEDSRSRPEIVSSIRGASTVPRESTSTFTGALEGRQSI
jgi:hypothetical protein